jgi:hypothetical protein
MKLGLFFTTMAVLASAACASQDTNVPMEIDGIGYRSIEELEEMLMSKFEGGQFTELGNRFTGQELFKQMENNELKSDFLIIAMLVTDGIWHDHYRRLFRWYGGKHSKTMLRRLMEEMGTGKIYLNIKRGIVGEMAQSTMPDEDLDRKINVVNALTKRYILDHSRWESVLKLMLCMGKVRDGIGKGAYSEELKGILGKEGLADVFYECVLRKPRILYEMANTDEDTTRQIVRALVSGGYWLYHKGLLKFIKENPRMVGLFPGHNVLEELLRAHMREGCAYRDDLSDYELAELVNDEFLKMAVGRLLNHGHWHYLKELLDNLLGTRTENIRGSQWFVEVLNRRIKEVIECGDINKLVALLDEVPEAKELLENREFDVALKNGMEKLIENGSGDILKKLLSMVPRAEGLLNSAEFDDALKKGMEELLGKGCVDRLQGLLSMMPRAKELLSSGELDEALQRGMEKLIENGWMNDLQKFLSIVPRAKGLLNSAEFDVVLERKMEKLIENGWMDSLQILLSIVPRAKGLLNSAEFDVVLKRGMEKLIENGWIDKLQMLLSIVPRARELFNKTKVIIYEEGNVLPNDNYTCSICLGEYQTGEQIKPLPCKHHFHEKCVDEWLSDKNSCPVCRREVNSLYGLVDSANPRIW